MHWDVLLSILLTKLMDVQLPMASKNWAMDSKIFSWAGEITIDEFKL